MSTWPSAQTIGWDARRQLPPYDGQLYQDAFGDIANGAFMVSYWHWASLHDGQEIYWQGVLGHDLEPNRAYAEVSRIGNDLKRVGPTLANLTRRNEVAILYSLDSLNALNAMPYDRGRQNADGSWHPEGYLGVLQQLHRTLYRANVGTDFVDAHHADFSGYKLLIVPALYVADDGLLSRITRFVADGGHVIMTFRSGMADEHAMVRPALAPGPLRAAAGVSYQEVSTLVSPVKLRGDPFRVGRDANEVSTIAEFLKLEGAEPLAFYDHPFFGQWPAITRHAYGKGSVVYEDTIPSDAIQAKVIDGELRRMGMRGSDQDLPANVRIKHAVGQDGRGLHFLFNYSAEPARIVYSGDAARDLLSGTNLSKGVNVTLAPWGVMVAQDTAHRPGH